jgi:hypothetical protein
MIRQDVYGFDCTNGLLAIPTEDYCIQFYSLFENTEVSEVGQSLKRFIVWNYLIGLTPILLISSGASL